MSTINNSLPDEMRNWILADRLAIGQFHNASKYFRDLLRRDQELLVQTKAFETTIALGRAAPSDPRAPEAIFAGIKHSTGAYGRGGWT